MTVVDNFSEKPPPSERFRPMEVREEWMKSVSAGARVRLLQSGAGVRRTWLVSNRDDVVRVLSDDDNFGVQDPLDPKNETNVSIFQDGENHKRLRRTVANAFTASNVRRYESRIATWTEGYLEATSQLGREGWVDASATLAKPLTMNTICEIVGIPEDARSEALSLSDRLLVPVGTGRDEVPMDAWQALNEYVHQLVVKRRMASEGDDAQDLITSMRRHQETDASLSDREIVTMLVGLPIAGYVSTSNAIVLALHLMFGERWIEALRDAKSGVTLGGFVEELLRFQSGDNGESMPRFVQRDHTYLDQQMRRGDVVLAPLLVANRDPWEFEEAERFDPTRRELARTVPFGAGRHRCLGAQLAALELRIALRVIVDGDVDFRAQYAWEQLDWRSNMLGDAFPARFPVTTV